MNVYNPNESVTLQEIKHYLDQLGPKFIFVGDFNAHSPLFQSNCGNSNFTGRTLENIVLDLNYVWLFQ